MADEMIFDYFYGQEAEMLSFYRIPRMVVKDAHFASLSSDAKILYGLVLDRMSMSIKNGWQDDEDRTYIYYTIEDVMEDLNCGNKKAGNLRKELEEIGLIERVKRGQGKPDIIYVKNFMGIRRVKDTIDSNEKEAAKPCKQPDVSKRHVKKCQSDTSRNVETTSQEMSDEHVKECQSDMPRNVEGTQQEVSYGHGNYNNTNQNEFNHTEGSHINPISLIDARSESNADRRKREIDSSPRIQIDPDYPITVEESMRICKTVAFYEGLPEEILNSPETVMEYIIVLAGCENLDSMHGDKQSISIMILEALVEMILAEKSCTYDGHKVEPGEVLYQVNRICKYDLRNNLMFFMDCVKDRFQKALNEYDIGQPKRYVKTIIWNAFETYQVDLANQNAKKKMDY